MTEAQEQRMELMEQFRYDMSGIEATTLHHDNDPHPGFVQRPWVFKYEHSTFLFRVWCAGKDRSPKP